MPTPPQTPTSLYTSNPIFDILKQYWWAILILGVGLIILFIIDRITRKEKPIVINRCELERQKRIDELKFNSHVIPREVEEIVYRDTMDEKTGEIKKIKEKKYNIIYEGYRWISHGRILKGKITNIKINDENDKDKTKSYEIVYTPIRFKFLFFRVCFGKQEVLFLHESSIDLLPDSQEINVKREVSIDSAKGWKYDIPNELMHLNKINEQIWKHDVEQTHGFYEAESQKKSIIDIAHAETMAEKQLDLQIEEERRKRVVT